MEPKLTHVKTTQLYQVDAAYLLGLLGLGEAHGPGAKVTDVRLTDGPDSARLEFEVTEYSQ